MSYAANVTRDAGLVRPAKRVCELLAAAKES